MNIFFKFNRLLSLPSMLCIYLPILVFTAGCDKSSGKSDKKAAPAKVEMTPHETELSTLTLTSSAVRNLAIKTVQVEQRDVSRHRTFAGEAMVPSGRSIIVSAPVSGVIANAGESMALPGNEVKIAQAMMILDPMLSPERDVATPAEQVAMTSAKANLMSTLVLAQGEVARGESEIEGLKISRDRADQLLKDRAGSRRALDDAEALLSIAQSVLTAANQREKELKTLLQSLQNANSGDKTEPASPLTITAPISGIVRSVNVSPGQNVVAGAPLFEILDLSTIWIRVPVYVDLLWQLKPEQTATLVSLDGTKLGNPVQSTSSPDQILAIPIAAPPTANAASSSADLYYQVDNKTLRLRPGQRIGVDLPVNSIRQALIVPTAAILYDIYGGTWVYVEKASASDSTKYGRQRVLLEWVDGDDAIVSGGPAIGAKVVTAGAAELFGTEFGVGK